MTEQDKATENPACGQSGSTVLLGGCSCSMRIRVLGDGCDICNPSKALEYARETMTYLQAHRDMLWIALREAKDVIEELCACHKHPEPEATIDRIEKALNFDA